MSYEEIDKSLYGTDVFTNGAKGRYAKAEPTADAVVKTGEKKKRAPKAPASAADEPAEQPDDATKTKKKSRKVRENAEANPEVEGEAPAKPKKKKAPKAESNTENIDPAPTTEAEPVKKKKTKTPKAPTGEADAQPVENPTGDGLEVAPKVKKPKKHKTPKTTDAGDAIADDNAGEMAYSVAGYASRSLTTWMLSTALNRASRKSTTKKRPTKHGFNEAPGNDGAFGSTADDSMFDFSSTYPADGEPFPIEPEKSDYETAIINAYNDLAGKLNFAMYVGDDQWTVVHPPKSARGEPKSRIRKMLPTGKEEKGNAKPPAAKAPNQKSGFLNRFRTGVTSLVRDENNMLFGDQAKYDLNYYDDEDDDVDTDDLHRYAQKLRELEDTDREVNPEFLVLRDGKTVYAVHEADAEGKMTLSTRKPIYDRYRDQAPDDEPAEKKKLLARLKNPFGRNKEKDGKGSNSPKPSNIETPDPSGKRKGRKGASKAADDDVANSEILMD